MSACTVQRACLWSGPAFIGLFFGGILIAGWLPPLSANDSAKHVAAMYLHDADRIRMGAVLIGAASIPQGILAALMSRHMRRIEGQRPLLTYTQLSAGATAIFVVILPAFLFAAAAFRPERDPAITQVFHDLGWLCLVGVGWPAILQCIAVGLATLTDPGRRPVFPRWFGWFNLWVAFAFLPGPFLVFFHTGPFAWDGAAVFWVPATVFGAWIASWFVVLRRAISDEEAGDAALHLPDPSPLLRRREELGIG